MQVRINDDDDDYVRKKCNRYIFLHTYIFSQVQTFIFTVRYAGKEEEQQWWKDFLLWDDDDDNPLREQP